MNGASAVKLEKESEAQPDKPAPQDSEGYLFIRNSLILLLPTLWTIHSSESVGQESSIGKTLTDLWNLNFDFNTYMGGCIMSVVRMEQTLFSFSFLSQHVGLMILTAFLAVIASSFGKARMSIQYQITTPFMFFLASFPLTVALAGGLPNISLILVFAVAGLLNIFLIGYAMNCLFWLVVPYDFAWMLMGRRHTLVDERLTQPRSIYRIVKLLGPSKAIQGLAVTAYLLLIFVWALVHFKADPNPQNLAEYLNEVGKTNEHNLVQLRFLYLVSIPFQSLPYGFFPAGFWLVNGNFGPFLAFIPSAILVSWYRRNIEHGVPVWFTGAMHVVGGFPLVCYLLQSLPNHYQIPMFVLSSFLAMFTYHFLFILLVGMWFQNVAKGILEFLGLKPKGT
jgi:hypothetical protein